ncbi:PREDICTED: uncharacterized protein LOC109581621 isoform X2 [Amphimedon queenslandica]|nr:PREDICTED: uncharacterized protein LOC109581621 isoform X2 [Amphimedon queenslandica]|eukprot:XP_019851457.1 PREDICTED: uncharacterized protein LOC109581621 isoform X2 [Amphimedon queenslandica]
MGLSQSLNCFYSKGEAIADCNQLKCNVKFMGRTRSQSGLGDVCKLCIEAYTISKKKLKNKEKFLFEIQDDHFVIEGKRGTRKLALSSVTIIKSINSDKTFLVIIKDKDGTFHVETYSSTEKAKMNEICDFFKTHQSGVFSEISNTNDNDNEMFPDDVEPAMEYTESSDAAPISKPIDNDHSYQSIDINFDDHSSTSTDVNADATVMDAADGDNSMAKVKGLSGLITVPGNNDVVPVDTTFTTNIEGIISAISDDTIAADIQSTTAPLANKSSALDDSKNIADDDFFGEIQEELENWANNLISIPNLRTPEPPVKHVEFAEEDDVLSCSSSDVYYALSSSDDSLASIWHLFGADLLYSSYEDEDSENSDSVEDENDYEETESDYSPSEMEDTWSTSSSEYSLDDHGRLTRSESAPVVIRPDASSLSSYEWEHTQSC